MSKQVKLHVFNVSFVTTTNTGQHFSNIVLLLEKKMVTAFDLSNAMEQLGVHPNATSINSVSHMGHMTRKDWDGFEEEEAEVEATTES